MRISKLVKVPKITTISVIAAMLTVVPEHINARQQIPISYHGGFHGAYYHPTPLGYLSYTPGKSSRTQENHQPAPQNIAADASATSSQAGASSKNVVIDGMRFLPATVYIRAGDTVTWINHEPMVHTLTSQNNGLLASEPLGRGSIFSHRFRQPGVFHYYCVVHPSKNGFIVVQ